MHSARGADVGGLCLNSGAASFGVNILGPAKLSNLAKVKKLTSQLSVSLSRSFSVCWGPPPLQTRVPELDTTIATSIPVTQSKTGPVTETLHSEEERVAHEDGERENISD
ncbi:unnamed protein product [Pleuronectes platessa]|uniref:Uncharacterized protein n=1 Tax=Pleuronectes platessa TaxID=8262 RepID=A0A9N7VM48_PLEPL|nr:unnamed protein product [Pleuronectes platessa]